MFFIDPSPSIPALDRQRCGKPESPGFLTHSFIHNPPAQLKMS
jgi:hypothetical protein